MSEKQRERDIEVEEEEEDERVMGGCLELLVEWCGVRGRGLSRLWDELLGGGLGPGRKTVSKCEWK